MLIHPTIKEVKTYFGRQKLQAKVDFHPLQRNKDEKLYKHSLAVQQGERFSVDQKQFLALQKLDKKNKFENAVVYEEILAEMEVKYMDYYSAVFKGYISQKNINHLRLIPEQYLLKNENTALICLNAIISSYEGQYVPADTITEKFLEYVGLTFDHLEIGSLLKFLYKYSLYF